MHEYSLAEALVEQVERDAHAGRWRNPCRMDHGAAAGARNPTEAGHLGPAHRSTKRTNRKRTSYAIDGKARRVEGEDPGAVERADQAGERASRRPQGSGRGRPRPGGRGPAGGQTLRAGDVGVVADVTEEWVAPVDARMEALSGVVCRRAKGEVLAE